MPRFKVSIKIDGLSQANESELLKEDIGNNWNIETDGKGNFYISGFFESADKNSAEKEIESKAQTILDALSFVNRCSCNALPGISCEYLGADKHKILEISQGTRVSFTLNIKTALTQENFQQMAQKTKRVLTLVQSKEFPEFKMALSFYHSHFTQATPEIKYLFLWQAIEVLAEAKRIKWSNETLTFLDSLIKKLKKTTRKTKRWNLS